MSIHGATQASTLPSAEEQAPSRGGAVVVVVVVQVERVDGVAALAVSLFYR